LRPLREAGPGSLRIALRCVPRRWLESLRPRSQAAWRADDRAEVLAARLDRQLRRAVRPQRCGHRLQAAPASSPPWLSPRRHHIGEVDLVGLRRYFFRPCAARHHFTFHAGMGRVPTEVAPDVRRRSRCRGGADRAWRCHLRLQPLHQGRPSRARSQYRWRPRDCAFATQIAVGRAPARRLCRAAGAQTNRLPKARARG